MTILFDDSEFHVEVLGTATISDLKDEVCKATNIVPKEQMLAEEVSQMEPEGHITIDEVAAMTGVEHLRFHLLTPNSAV